jgi:hypothetical protein
MPYPMIRALPTLSCSIMRSCFLHVTAAAGLALRLQPQRCLVTPGSRED